MDGVAETEIYCPQIEMSITAYIIEKASCLECFVLSENIVLSYLKGLGAS